MVKPFGGSTNKEKKMRFRVRRLGAKERALRMWHPWFAWRPVRVPERGNTIVWLETVEVRCWQWFDYGGSGWTWQYRDLKEATSES